MKKQDIERMYSEHKATKNIEETFFRDSLRSLLDFDCVASVAFGYSMANMALPGRPAAISIGPSYTPQEVFFYKRAQKYGRASTVAGNSRMENDHNKYNKDRKKQFEKIVGKFKPFNPNQIIPDADLVEFAGLKIEPCVLWEYASFSLSISKDTLKYDESLKRLRTDCYDHHIRASELFNLVDAFEKDQLNNEQILMYAEMMLPGRRGGWLNLEIYRLNKKTLELRIDPECDSSAKKRFVLGGGMLTFEEFHPEGTPFLKRLIESGNSDIVEYLVGDAHLKKKNLDKILIKIPTVQEKGGPIRFWTTKSDYLRLDFSDKEGEREPYLGNIWRYFAASRGVKEIKNGK